MARILVVDDYPVTLRVLSMQLRKGGYEATTALSATLALEALAEESFDLALFDVAMPDVDGISLIRSVRQQWPDRTMPIVVLTASVLDEDRVRAEEAGANAFLTKPISSWELLEVVEGLLSSETESALTTTTDSSADLVHYELPNPYEASQQ